MKLKVESKILYRLQLLPNEVMHVLNCPLKLYLTNSHRHLDLLCLLIDPCFPNDSFKQKNSRVFYIPKKSRFRYFEKSNANILQTISCFKQVHKKWGFYASLYRPIFLFWSNFVRGNYLSLYIQLF